MADNPTKKASAFPLVTASAAADSIPIVRAGVTSRIHPASGGGLDADTVDGQHAAALCPVGAMMPYAGSSAPSGWLLCDGQAVSRTTYSALFTAISTTWGVGDGSTTFNVPDFREASPYGVGTRAAGVTAHDAATLGEFKDDQMQQITGALERVYGVSASSGAFTHTGLPNLSAAGSSPLANKDVAFDSANSPGARTGTTTRGKIIGVNFIIKY